MMSNEDGIKRRVYAREKYCIGCRLCEIHCIAAHSKYKGNMVKAYKKQEMRPLSGITVEEKIPVSFGLQCRHCDDPICVKSCITGAMYKDETNGTVLNERDRCVGCWTCVLYARMALSKETGLTAKLFQNVIYVLIRAIFPLVLKIVPTGRCYLNN